jgi:PAS domain S-box-containing protein
MDHKIKILHIEDVETDALLVEFVLQKSTIKFEKQVVDNRVDYVRALKRFDPDIIISDHSLPGFNSLDALKILKERGYCIPFILVTATVSEEFAVNIMREGASDYILKDRMQRLPIAIVNCIEKAELEKEQLKFLKELITNEAFLIEAEKIAAIGSMEVEIRSQDTKWSPGLHSILGYSMNEVKPSLQKFIDCVHPDDVETVKREIDHAISSRQSVMLNFRTRSEDGNVKYVHTKILIHTDREGHAAYLKGFAQDVTGMALSEKSLLTANQEKQNAEHLAKTKQMFLANMSHEIRTPMNAIIGMSNQLGKTTLDEKQKFYLDTIHSAADNLLSIINDILDLAKIEAGKIQMEHIGFSFKELIDKTIKVLSFSAEEKGLPIIISGFDENISPNHIGDPHRISQVLINLLTNAIKFTEKGEVQLSIEVLEERAESQTLQVQVKDTGIGMDQSFIKHLFDKFSQENESTTRIHGGTGLGMSICKELIELMGGKIYAKSKKGAGTTVSFIIELMKGTPADLPPEKNVTFNEGFLSGKKILVADDNDMNRLLAAVILQNYGAEIIEAKNGEQAIMMADQKPDLILMDIQMPVLNGFDAARILRQNGIDIPMIALTANAVKGERERSVASGMNDYIAKPFDEEDFLDLVNKWLKAYPSGVPNLVIAAFDEPLYDLSKLRAISRGNEAFVQKMIWIFCEQAPHMVSEMITASGEKDFARIAALAHKIKPGIDDLCIHSLVQRIRDIEKAAKDNIDISQLSGQLKEIAGIVENTVAQMSRDQLPRQGNRV